MTCIIGLVANGEVWVGADGRATFDYWNLPISDPKIARIGEMIIGCAGTPRILQVLQVSPDVPKIGSLDPYNYLCGPFARWVLGALKEEESLPVADALPNTKSYFVIGLQRRLFLMDGCFSVYESQRGFAAAGTGLEVASGFLMATPLEQPEKRILGALEAASEMLPSCGAPFHVERL